MKHLLRGRGARGFSTMELIVVVGMIMVIMSVILMNSNKQRGNILVTNLAYDLALNFREVQQYGIAVRETAPGSGEFDRAYGIRFVNVGTINSYDLFTDTNNDGDFDTGETVLRTVALPAGYYIERFCGTPPSGVEVCSPSIASLFVTYKRPDPDALIEGPSDAPYISARVRVRQTGGPETAEVTVTNTGQIAVSE